jgi:hypothetical protein
MTHPRHAFHFNAMATTFTVTIAQEDIDETYASQAANAVRMEVERLEEELSRFKTLQRDLASQPAETRPTQPRHPRYLGLSRARQSHA